VGNFCRDYPWRFKAPQKHANSDVFHRFHDQAKFNEMLPHAKDQNKIKLELKNN